MVSDEGKTGGLYRLNKDEVKRAAEVVARAFQDYPLSVYFIPDESVRRRKLPLMFQPLLRHGLSYSEVYATSPKLEGIAVWFRPDGKRETLWSKIRSGSVLIPFIVGIGALRRQIAFGRWAASVRKRCVPGRYWYLQLLGVEPAYQGRGYASALLKPMLERIDGEGLPCYVETQTEKNVPLYEHLGFRVVEEGIVPGSEVRSWAMVREAGGDKGDR
jgi:ribosomal protein S18 acetylase RimI-like enzyme